MDPQHLTRLQQEQSKAVSDTNQQILQIEKFKSDYKVLQDRLKTLPEELAHDIMVPFGKLAFMPGKLVHTNQLLVLLGDNWFVERSAKQAEDIAQRRIQELNKQLKNLRAQKKLLDPRLDFTSDFESHIKGQKDVKEIVEEYDAEKERLWDEQHKKNVRKQREVEKHSMKNSQPSTVKAKKEEDSDTDLWSRLDALEKEEAERGELESGNSEEETEEMIRSLANKGVSWHDETKAEDRQESDAETSDGTAEDASDEDGDDSDDDDCIEDIENAADEDRKQNRPVVRTIRFTHTDTPSHETQYKATAEDTIQSPADIYKLYSPASILKKAVFSEQSKLKSSKVKRRTSTEPTSNKSVAFSSSDDDRFSAQQPCTAELPKPAASSSLKAFSGKVLETSQDKITYGHDPTGRASDTVTKDQPPKRVSKFKASRMTQQGFS